MAKDLHLAANVWILAAVMIGAVVLNSAISIHSAYRSKLELVEQQADHSFELAREIIKHDTDNILSVMRMVGDLARREIGHGHSLSTFQWDVPLSRTMIVIDGEGRIIADSRTDTPALGRSVVDREYFAIHRTPAGPATYIGPNVRSRVDGHWSLPVSIPVRDLKEGGLIAVVSAAIDPVAWASAIHNRMAKLGIEVFITDQNDTILLKAPFSEDLIGSIFDENTVAPDKSTESSLFGTPERLFFPKEKLLQVHPFEALPLNLVVAYSTKEIADSLNIFLVDNAIITLSLIAIIIFFAAIQRRSNAETERIRNRLIDSLEASSEGFALFDKNDRLVVCNKVYRDFYKTHEYSIEEGRTLEEIIRAGLAEDAFPQARGREEAWLAERLRQHQKTESVEQQLADGRWLKVSERRTMDGGIVGVRTDITDLKQRENDLRESQKRLQDFTDTASDWVWECDANHRCTFVGGGGQLKDVDSNPVFEIGKALQEYTFEDTNTEKWREHLSNLDAHLAFSDFRFWMRPPNGYERLITISGLPVFDEKGTFSGFRGTGRDITEEHRHFEQITALEERFRIGFESITIGIVLSDSQGRILAFNPAAENLFGYSEGELIGRNVSVLANDTDHGNHRDYMQAYQQSRKPQIIGNPREVMGRKKNGELFPLILGIAEMTSGGQRQYIASLVDVSHERELEAQLRQTQKMDAVGQLVGGLSHDFNNLLGIIIGNLDLINRDLELGSSMERRVSRALKAAQRGSKLTRRLLNFARQDPEESDAIDVHEVLTQLQELIQKSLTSTIPVTLSLNSRMPRVAVEQGDLEDAIINLCLNARDAMPDGGRIVIETTDLDVTEDETDLWKELVPGHYIAIQVTDTGTGIPSNLLENIFDPFFTTKERGKGTGLGLSMVYGFAKRAGGTINVRSEEGVGTSFNLVFPASSEAENSEKVRPLEPLSAESPTRAETVLIVDDEEDLAEVAASVLGGEGYSTIVAHNAASALDIIDQRNDISLLFSDVVMPGDMDGLGLMTAVRRQRPDLAICLTSGYSKHAEEENPRLDGVSLLKKPYNNDQLVKFIEEVLAE
ncbi:MAG: PAS domain S-box protein [Magnetovibrionaceae bacterium]